MISSKREKTILELLTNKGVISIKETAEIIGVSDITIRRDFDRLEQEGKLKKVAGGATSKIANDYQAELTSKLKQSLNYQEKIIVANYAASLINHGDCIFIDSGSTMIPFVEKILDKKIIIVTNNNFIPQIAINPNATIFILGGKLLPEFNMNIGPLVLEQLKNFHFNKVFIGCSGLDPFTGDVFTSELESYTIKNYLIEQSCETYLLIDSSKLVKTSVIKFSNAKKFTSILCDKNNTKISRRILSKFKLL